MNKNLVVSSLAVSCLGVFPILTKAEVGRPNIIVFMVDDMGWQDTSLPFWTQTTPYNRMYDTPNIERLARQGVMFTQAYACPVSSPSRCSLMTGMNMARHRVTNWTLQRDKTQTLRVMLWICLNGTAMV